MATLQPTNQPTPTVWQLVIHREITAVDFLWDYLKNHTKGYVASQHDADTDIARTHIHVLLRDFDVTKQALTKFLNGNGIKGSDNFGILTVYPKTKEPYDEERLAIYILKGKADNIKYFSYEERQLTQWASQWLDHKTPAIPIEKLKKEANHWELIQTILEQSRNTVGAWKTVMERDQDGTPHAVPGLTSEGRIKIFDLMCKTLNEHKVRTSRNELERFYVTIIRHDYHSRMSLRDSILKNVFREL